MADTPILNYKGKYDGPEIDKAVELALGLENPESCPYYVHISLSQPDYVLTIGLGDVEGNLFNHAEIDLPLESMVVNATYENGNIILHLQDGTSTEPIPISALIAGLVSETRTIAGIDLKDDITQKELRDALEVYTKDSVDQLVSDLEDRIDETLNEMKQSLDDLSDQVEQNKSDILTTKSNIAINRATLGTSSKNLAKITATTITNNGITATVNSDKSVTLNGTAAKQFETTIGVFSPKEKGTYILSRRPENSNGTSIRITDGQNFNIYLSQAEVTLNITNLKDYSINILVTSGTTVNNLVYQPMIRPADITDNTYEPYVPSVNERLTANENDILSVSNDTEINSLTLGTKVAKNLFNKDGQINMRYNGVIESNEGKMNTVNNNIVTFNTSSSTDVGTGQMISGLKHKKVIISFECVSVGTSSSNLGKLLIYKRNSNTALMSELIRLGDFVFEYDCGDNDELLFAFVVNGSGAGLQLKNIMIRSAEFANPMYVPYSTPTLSLQEQINALVAEIAELKAQITTE